MSIEGIVLEHFSSLPKADIHQTTSSCQRHAVFHSCLSGDIKQDAATTTEQRKSFISLLKDKKVLTSSLNTILENTDGCAKQYRCAFALYLMSVMSQCNSIIIYRGISAPRHDKYVVDGLNTVDKIYIYKLMCNVQLPGSDRFDSQTQMHTSNKIIMEV